jgi:uncharacterized protein (TIGR02646 family)
MEKIVRDNTNPKLQPILDNWLDWGNQWKNSTNSWTWNKIPDLKKTLNELLIELTNNRCAFCNYFPLVDTAHFTDGLSIDHFFPKNRNKRYAIYAYQWENLFPTCQKCNNIKDDFFCCLLLKPDEIHYDFDDYFIVDANGKIESNPSKDSHSQERAEKTIELCGLNRGELVENRRKIVEEFEALTPLFDNTTIFTIRPLDKEPYRFFVSRFINTSEVYKGFDDLLSELIQSSDFEPQTPPSTNEQ